MIVTPVVGAYLPEAWPMAKALLERGLWRLEGEADMDDVLNDLIVGRTSLWVGGEDGEIIAAVVVRIEERKIGRVAVLQMLGGEELNAWGSDMIGMIESYARDMGCTRVEGIGRLGWGRYAKQHNFRVQSVTVVKDLHHG